MRLNYLTSAASKAPLYNDRADPLPTVLPTGEALGVAVNNLDYFTLFLVKMTLVSERQPLVYHPALSEVRAASSLNTDRWPHSL